MMSASPLVTMQKRFSPQCEISLHPCGELKLPAKYLIVNFDTTKIFVLPYRGTPIAHRSSVSDLLDKTTLGRWSELCVGYGSAGLGLRPSQPHREMMPLAVAPHLHDRTIDMPR
jgi:hypothetical protein